MVKYKKNIFNNFICTKLIVMINEFPLSLDCGNLTDPLNGNVMIPVVTVVNSTANYSCNDNYTMIGDSSRQCLDSGVWGGVEPACLANGKNDVYRVYRFF